MPVGDPTSAGGKYSGAHVAAAGAASMSITQALADVYDWLLQWPIHNPTSEQCLSLAVLTIAILGGGGFAIFSKRGTSDVKETPAA